MADNTQTVFRKKTLDRIASPEQLTDYLRVTNPGIWVVLGAVLMFQGFLGSFMSPAMTLIGAGQTIQEMRTAVWSAQHNLY